MRPLWREFAIVLLAIACWVFFAVSTYGCAPAKSPDKCDVDLAAISAACSLDIQTCKTQSCVNEAEARCNLKIDEACK